MALERPRVLFEGEVLSGDLVDVFYTPAGDFILSKSTGEGFRIKSITNAYVSFEDDFSIQEV